MPQFQIIDATPEPFAFLPRSAAIADMKTVMPECYAELGRLFAEAGASPAGAPLTHYLDYDETSTTFEVGFPARAEDVEALRAAGLGIGSTPGGPVMTAVHVGPYETVHETYDALLADMRARGHTPTRDMWERYTSPPETPPDRIETEVIWPAGPAA